MSESGRILLKNTLLHKTGINSPTGHWSDYNRAWQAWNKLVLFSKAYPNAGFLKSDEVPDEPDVDNYSDLD